MIGPGSKRNWLSECYRKLKAGEPLTFVNPATLFNNACHIADLTEMIIQWLSDPKAGAHMVVVGASQEVMIRDVVGQLAESLKTRSNVRSGIVNYAHFSLTLHMPKQISTTRRWPCAT